MEWTNDSKHWWWQAFVSTGPIRACTCGKVHLRLPYMCLNLPASSWGSAQAAAGWLLLPHLPCCWNRSEQAEIHDATRALATGTQLHNSVEPCLGGALARWKGLFSSVQADLWEDNRFSHIWLAGEGSWRNIEGCRHTAVKTKLDEAAGSSSRQQQRNPSWAQISTLPLPTLALPGPQSWGILWGTAGVPVATQVWSQCKQQVTWCQLGHRGKKKRCRKLPEEAGKQRRGGIW